MQSKKLTCLLPDPMRKVCQSDLKQPVKNSIKKKIEY